jgi:polyhydroxyalkanoate synthesis regulator phasin
MEVLPISIMEDIWKKFREETEEHMQKIKKFLNEMKSDVIEPTQPEIPITKPNDEKSKIPELPQQVFTDETSQLIQEMFPNKTSHREKTYGKMRDLVKDIMEKEHLSRAQAYRKAKKRILSS